MSLKQKFVSAVTLVFAIVTLTVFASAQEKSTAPGSDSTQSQDKIDRRGPRPGRDGEGRGPGMHGPRGPEMMLRALHEVGLTDAQKEQIHTILESKRGDLEKLHDQLRELGRAKHEGTLTAEQDTQFNALREEMRTKAEATHQEILGVLTTEQRTKLDQIKQEMDQRRKERRERGPRPDRPQGAPPADKPTDN